MKNILKLILSLVALAAALLATVVFFERLPIEGTTLGMDWKGLWAGLQNGLQYGNATGLRITPWNALIVWPLGRLSFAASWGVAAFATMAVLVLCVPRIPSRGMFLFGVAALVLSFPALRTMADGNFEFLVIAGCLLLAYGVPKQNVPALIFGILLASAKLQQTWLLLLLLPVILWRRLDSRRLLYVVAGLALVCVPTLIWKGREWFEGMFAIAERGSQMDSSLWAAAARLGIPSAVAAAAGVCLAAVTVAAVWKYPGRFSRLQIGLMIAASLALSPYTAGNNFLTLYAVAAIPLLAESVPAGLAVIALANLPYLFLGSRGILYDWSAAYWTAVILILWVILLLRVVVPGERGNRGL